MTFSEIDIRTYADTSLTDLNITFNVPAANIDVITTFVAPEDLVKHQHSHKHTTDDELNSSTSLESCFACIKVRTSSELTSKGKKLAVFNRFLTSSA